MSRKKLTIGLFGFGCVGNGLYEVLKKTPALQARIKRICVKHKDKQRPLSPHCFTFEKQEILDDDDINTVVELIDDADAAYEIVTRALRKGKAVVTANKKMIAEHFTELIELQKSCNAPLLYEAACCASIPIIRNLEEYYDNDLLESVEGIVNGCTNFILTKTCDDHLTYRAALNNAQQEGYAESDPALDTEGHDAKYKLILLIAHAFGVVARPDEIYNVGIDNLGDHEFEYARINGFKIKLVAYAEKTAEGRIVSFVLPKFVKKTDRLYLVDDVFNGIVTRSYFSDTQFFVGKGAGAFPTASAVLSDISALSYDYRYEYKKLNSTDALEKNHRILLRVLMRHGLTQSFWLKKMFEEIHESYRDKEFGYIVGVISLQGLKEISGVERIWESVVLFELKKPKGKVIFENEIPVYEIGH